MPVAAGTATVVPKEVRTAGVALLGPFRVVLGGIALDLGRPKTKLVLARLALSAPESVGADTLIDAIWAGAPPATARKTLQKYISELRKALGSETIVTDGTRYAYARDPDHIDVHLFQQLLARARAARAQGRSARSWELLEDALGLWRGEALAGLEEVAFVTDEARRLGEMRLAALEEQMEIGLALGKHEALAPVLADLVERHPFRERFWGSLMTALYRCGRQVDALSAYRRLRGVLGEELGVDPSPELASLEERILVHDPSLHAVAIGEVLGNLPASYTTFVGRAKEVADLTELLATGRFVTLMGPGGSGKTRLGVEVAAEIQGAYRDGVWFVDLAPIEDSAAIVPTIAAAFGVAAEPGIPLHRTLLEHLGTKKALMILDNCEHLVTAAASITRAVLAATRSVTILTTSREPLGLTGEVVYQVGPLSIPGSDECEIDDIRSSESVRLFIDRATAADPEFRLTSSVAPAVADICRRLDGLPLAIELAARQLHVVGPAELRRSLLDHLDLLAAPGEPVARHRTMEAAVEWSYRLLDERQRQILDTASVFPGSFTPGAIVHVCRDMAMDVDEAAAVALLTGLASRSMAVRQPLGETTRYRLLEPIRTFSWHRMELTGRDGDLGRAHARWVLDFLLEDPQILGPAERDRLRALGAEHHHFPVALRWAIDRDPELALGILANLAEFTLMEEWRLSWAHDLFRSIAIQRDAPSSLRAAALANGAMTLAESFADYRTAHAWADDALTMAVEIADPYLIAVAEMALAISLRNTGDLEEALTHVERARESFDELQVPNWSARARLWTAQIELGRGDYDDAVAVCREARAIWQEVGSDWGTAKAWWLTAHAQARQGRYEEAESSAHRAVALLRGYEDPSLLAHVRAVEGDAARLAGRYERAESIYRDCLGGFRAIGDRRCVASSLKNLGVVAIHLDHPADAARLLMAALQRRSRLGDESGIPECLEGLALVAHRVGGSEAAVTLLAAAARLRAGSGALAPEVERDEIHDLLSRLEGEVATDRFGAAWTAGSELGPEGIVDDVRRLLPELLGSWADHHEATPSRHD